MDTGCDAGAALRQAMVEVLQAWANAEVPYHDAWWCGYAGLRSSLLNMGVVATLPELRAAMRVLSMEGHVKRGPTYDHCGRLCGSGWFWCGVTVD